MLPQHGECQRRLIRWSGRVGSGEARARRRRWHLVRAYMAQTMTVRSKHHPRRMYIVTSKGSAPPAMASCAANAGPPLAPSCIAAAGILVVEPMLVDSAKSVVAADTVLVPSGAAGGSQYTGTCLIEYRRH